MPDALKAAVARLDAFLSSLHNWGPSSKEQVTEDWATIKEQSKAEAWRPLADAPKEKFVLLCNADGEMVVAKQSQHGTRWDRSGKPARIYKPTHWMPLPDAPAEGEAL